MNKKYNFYAEGGSLNNHGLKEGDQIIKTMSGGVQKVKTKTGDIVYVNLANGYRGAEPPLPFAKGGEIEFEHSNLTIVGTGIDKNGNRVVKVSFPNQRPFSIQTNGNLPKTHSLLKDYDKKNTNFYKGEIESMEDEILDYIEKYGSENQKKSVRVYGSWLNKDDYAKGGGVRKVGNREYSTGRNWTNDHRHVNKSEQHEVNYNRRNSLFFAGGGEIRRFDRQAQMDSETREEILDVLSESDTPKVLTNYLYGLFDGYDYSETANFKKEVEFLKRKNPKLHQRVVDIYKKIDKYKFEKYGDNYATGGVTKNYINRNQLNTITIKKGDQKLTYKVSDVYNGAYKLEDGGNLEKTAFYVSKRNVVKVQLRDGKDVKVANGYWIKKGAKPIRASKFEDGGQLEIKFAGGGKLETKIQKKVDEVNSLIEKAIDKDGDPLMVVDTTGTWEEPMQYKPIVYKNGRLYFEYYEPYSGKTEKEVVNKSNIEFDGYPMLLDIAKMYGSALKQKGVSYAGGGDTKMVDGVMYEKVKFSNGVEDYYYSSDLHKVNSYCSENGLNSKNKKDFEKAFSELKKQNKIAYKEGGKTTFKQKATAIAKNFEGKKVEPKYQKEYGKTYDKAEAKEVGNKIAGSQKAKYDSKMSGGGKTKRGGAMQLAKQIRKDGESWQSALKRANEQVRNK